MKPIIKNKPIYIDVCALSRFFDEQDYLRIRIETDAVNLILSKVREGIYKLLVSPVHIREIDAIPDMLERVELKTILDKLGVPVSIDMSKTRKRDEEFVIKKGVEVLIKELGPMEAIRFINMPKGKRLESVKRHRKWQRLLDKDKFFEQIFENKANG